MKVIITLDEWALKKDPNDVLNTEVALKNP